jgi:hypothetical protein
VPPRPPGAIDDLAITGQVYLRRHGHLCESMAFQLPGQFADDEAVVHLVAEQMREPAAKFPVGHGQAGAIPIPFPDRNQARGCQHPAHLSNGSPRVGQMKQDLSGDDAVEGGIR